MPILYMYIVTYSYEIKLILMKSRSLKIETCGAFYQNYFNFYDL